MGFHSSLDMQSKGCLTFHAKYHKPLFSNFNDLPPDSRGLSSGAQKEPQSQNIARTAPKNFLNNSRGLPVIFPLKRGFWGKTHQKVHRKVRRNLCRKSSLGYLFCPWFPCFFDQFSAKLNRFAVTSTSVQTRGIAMTSGISSGICKDW